MQYNLRMLGIIALAYLRGAVLFFADILGSCG
jgi:GTP1/Obg family GTP-binding protein